MIMRKINKIAATLIFSLGIIGPAPPAFTQAMVIDHTCTNLSQIPDSWITQARAISISPTSILPTAAS